MVEAKKTVNIMGKEMVVTSRAYECEGCEHAKECDEAEAYLDRVESYHAARGRQYKIDCKRGVPPDFFSDETLDEIGYPQPWRQRPGDDSVDE